VRRERAAAGLEGPYDVVVGGSTLPGDDAAQARLARLEAAGATWWIEQDWADTSADALRERIRAGPTRARVRYGRRQPPHAG
jgi:hypothetical protein